MTKEAQTPRQEFHLTVADIMGGARPPKGTKLVRTQRTWVKCPMSLIGGKVVRVTKVFQ